MTRSLLLLLLLCQSVAAQSTGSGLFQPNGTNLARDDSLRASLPRPDQLVVVGQAERRLWLGVSFYKQQKSLWSPGLFPTSSSANSDFTRSRHRVMVVQPGKFRRNIFVSSELRGGTFQIALWGQRVLKGNCTLDSCKWCRLNGFHMAQLIQSSSGNSSP